MTPDTPYFQNQLAITTQAQVILTTRETLVRLQQERDTNRQFLSFVDQSFYPATHRGVTKRGEALLRLSIPTQTNHPSAFELMDTDEAASIIRLKLADLDNKISALRASCKQQTEIFLDLKPDLDQPEYRFLLTEPK